MVHLAIFAKYWEPGKVKTRLAKKLGDSLACEVYIIFLKYLLKQYSEFGDGRAVIFTPRETETLFREAVSPHWDLCAQENGDLGVRMRCFFERFSNDPQRKNILIGSDTPDLPPSIVRQAANALDEVPVVIGPSADGGYYLIAVRGNVPDIFSGIPWSTEQVLELTLAKLKQQDIPFRMLPELKDVDEWEDLQRLIGNLSGSDAHAELLSQLTTLELPVA